jgi:hypothetical protein
MIMYSFIYMFLYSIYYENEGGSWPVSGVDRYVIIRKLLDSIFNIIPVLIRRWDIQTYLHRFFLP